MQAKKKTPGAAATAPASEGWSFATESHQSKRADIVGNCASVGQADPAVLVESLTVAQCRAMRAEAQRFGYALTWAMVPGAGLRWYAKREGAAPVVLGTTAGVHRFLTMHSRWMERPGRGQAKMDNWLHQKTRSQLKRAIQKAKRRASSAAGVRR
jgi:hypothetical protein